MKVSPSCHEAVKVSFAKKYQFSLENFIDLCNTD